MERSWKQYESLLRRMAESMGLMIVVTPSTVWRGSTWCVATTRGGHTYHVTLSYFSPAALLDKFLNHYSKFQGHPNLGQTIPNAFYGMSPEEAELRLAVMGVTR